MFLYDCSLLQIIAKNEMIDKKHLEKYDSNGCNGRNAYIPIDVFGNFKPCSFWNETFGSAKTLDFNEWINNEKLIDFRNKKYQVTAMTANIYSYAEVVADLNNNF